MLFAVRDRAPAVEALSGILGAEQVREDEVRLYSARRTVLQAGDSELELLEPDGDGPVAQHLERSGEGLFAAGFSTSDVSGVSRSMTGVGVRFAEEGDQIFVEPDQTPGMRCVISEHRELSPVGRIRCVYEVTNIVDDHEQAASFYARAFGLDQARFCPIKSEDYGYKGTLTLFNPPERLDRIELTQITEPSRPMGRYFARRGQSIYMCFAEADDVDAIQGALEDSGARYATERDGKVVFIHPSALHGALMGVSKTTVAWVWSGRPDLVQA